MRKSVLNLFKANKNFSSLPSKEQENILEIFKTEIAVTNYEDWMDEIVKEDEDITEQQSETIEKIQAINFLEKYKF